MIDKDEFEVLLGNDEVSEDESEGDLDSMFEDEDNDDLGIEASDEELLNELYGEEDDEEDF